MNRSDRRGGGPRPHEAVEPALAAGSSAVFSLLTSAHPTIHGEGERLKAWN